MVLARVESQIKDELKMNSSLNDSDDAPVVSIITPTFNSSKYIRECYDSICSQTVTDWEWLVTDDCSSDNTMMVIESIAKADCRVIFHQNEFNVGSGDSRNYSIDKARGEFIAFLDSDDLWLEGKLAQQLAFMGDEIDFSFTGFSVIDKNGKPTGISMDATLRQSITYNDMLKKRATLGCSTVILRRSKVLEERMPSIRTGQDYAFWLQLLRKGLIAEALPSPLTSYRITPGSISRNKAKKALRQWQIYRQIENLGFVKSVYCFGFYAFRAIITRA